MNKNSMKSVLITGGNEGIGFHMVSQLLKKGKRVAVLDLHINNLEELKEKYGEKTDHVILLIS